MPVHFISDLHLTRDRPDITARFTQFCRTLGSDTRALYILGDLFEYWIGDDGAEALGVDPVLDELSRISDTGIPVHVMHGNRDFLLGDQFAERTGCELIDDPCVVSLYGNRVLLAHGDAYCTDDVEHQSWRRLYLDKAWQAEQLAQPISIRIAVANELRKRSQASLKGKPMAIMDVTDAAVISAMNENKVDVLIHGHTHRPGLHHYNLTAATDAQRIPAREANTPVQDGYRLVLGDWYEQSSQIVVTADSVILQPGDHQLPGWCQS